MKTAAKKDLELGRLKIYLDLGVICTQITVNKTLNKQALETSYSSNIPFMSKEM